MFRNDNISIYDPPLKVVWISAWSSCDAASGFIAANSSPQPKRTADHADRHSGPAWRFWAISFVLDMVPWADVSNFDTTNYRCVFFFKALLKMEDLKKTGQVQAALLAFLNARHGIKYVVHCCFCDMHTDCCYTTYICILDILLIICRSTLITVYHAIPIIYPTVLFQVRSRPPLAEWHQEQLLPANITSTKAKRHTPRCWIKRFCSSIGTTFPTASASGTMGKPASFSARWKGSACSAGSSWSEYRKRRLFCSKKPPIQIRFSQP